MSGDLLEIRRHLTLSGDVDRDKLHATTDKQSRRDVVFTVLNNHSFSIDVTLLEKAKAEPLIREDPVTFYRHAWHHHFAHVAPRLFLSGYKNLITAASLGSKRTRAAFKLGVNNILQQTAPRSLWEVSFMDSAKDPMLWAVDYCAWAIQRKWERGDTRSYDLIRPKIVSELDLWAESVEFYY